MSFLSVSRRSILQAVLTGVLILLLVVLIDLITNRVEEVKGHIWDFVYYIDIAENGLIGNDHLASPYAYRALTPLLARWIKETFAITTATSFKTLAYIGVILQLAGVYLFTRQDQRRFGTAMIVLLLPVFSLFNVKFLVFDSYRPDLLAYPILAFGLICLVRGWIIPAVILAVVGIQMRETPAILALIAIYELSLQYKKSRQVAPLVSILLIILVMGLAFALPRALIPVKFTQQILDPFNNPRFLEVVFGMFLDWKRDLNLVYNFAAYLLPLWLIATPASLRRVWNKLGKWKAWLVIYLGVIFLMALYGGTDMMRYVTYLFLPQALLIGRLIEDEQISLEQILFTILAIFIFNRIFLELPVWDFYKYLDFYGGYGNRLVEATLLRYLELFGWILLGVVVRRVISFGADRAAWKN